MFVCVANMYYEFVYFEFECLYNKMGINYLFLFLNKSDSTN